MVAFSPKLGRPEAVTLDNGFLSETNIRIFEQRKIEAYIATSREAHLKDLNSLLGKIPSTPSADASPKEKPALSIVEGMAYKLAIEIGHAIYRLRKCSVEPVIGIIKRILGFRQFSLRGMAAAAGIWCLVCLAFNIKRMHILWMEQGLL